MPRAKATDRLTIKGLSAEDLEWLKAESNRLGCDPENLVRMMIRQRSSAVVVPVGVPVRADRIMTEEEYWAKFEREHRDPMPGVPPEVEQTPDAEPSLDEVMAQPPRLSDTFGALNDRPAPTSGPAVGHARLTPYDPIAAQRGGRGTQFQRRADIARRNVLPYPTGAYAAFSETEPVSNGTGFIGERPLERFVAARR